MKKVLLLFVSVLIFGTAFSQVKLGLNLNTGLLVNRVVDPKVAGDSLTYGNKGAGMKFTLGPDIHIMFSDNYGVALGLWYAAKRAGVTVIDTKNHTTRKDTYTMQYVELPVTLRMFTNEIATDMKLYFMVGGTADIKLSTKNNKIAIANDPVITKFGRFDATVLAGAGVEIQMGSATALTGGLRYQRSLINNTSKFDNGINKFKLNSDFISIDLGIKF